MKMSCNNGLIVGFYSVLNAVGVWSAYCSYELSYGIASYKYCSYSCCGTYYYRYCCSSSYYYYYYYYNTSDPIATAGAVVGGILGGIILVVIVIFVVKHFYKSSDTRGGVVVRPQQDIAIVTTGGAMNTGIADVPSKQYCSPYTDQSNLSPTPRNDPPYPPTQPYYGYTAISPGHVTLAPPADKPACTSLPPPY